MDHKITYELLQNPFQPLHSQNHLISIGSQTTCNRELGYHDNCTLYKGYYHVPTYSDFITFRWLVNIHVTMPAKAQSHYHGVSPGDHYMPLQMFTTWACHAFLPFPLTSGPASSAKVSPDLRLLLHHVDPGHVLCLSPCNRARLTTNNIPD
jgi:hypothetical protein